MANNIGAPNIPPPATPATPIQLPSPRHRRLPRQRRIPLPFVFVPSERRLFVTVRCGRTERHLDHVSASAELRMAVAGKSFVASAWRPRQGVRYPSDALSASFIDICDARERPPSGAVG